MFALVKDDVQIVIFLRKLRGGSQPILAQASDGLTYVVKFNNNLQGANLLFNESIGTELYKAFWMSVPSWKPVRITDTFLDRNPGCWIETEHERIRPNSGICFGSQFLGGNGVTIKEILSSNSLGRVQNHESFWLAWMIDICAEHADNRQAVFLEDRTKRLKAFFVDHGCMFGGAKGMQMPHFMASRYLDPRIYQNLSSQYRQHMLRIALSLDADRLWKEIRMLPEEWKVTSAVERFERCLDRFSKTELLQNIVDTILDANQRDRESRRRRPYPESTFPILCSGIQTKRQGHNFIDRRTDRVACP